MTSLRRRPNVLIWSSGRCGRAAPHRKKNRAAERKEAVSAYTAIEDRLRPGERVLWFGGPSGSILSPLDSVWVPAGVLWVFVSGLLTAFNLSNPSSPFAAGFSLAMVGIGMYFAVGRLWVKARWRRATIYLVTSERAVQKSRGELRFIELRDVPSLEVNVTGRRGSMVFGTTSMEAGYFANLGLDFFVRQHGGLPLTFYDVQDPERVAQTVVEAARAMGRGPGAIEGGGLGVTAAHDRAPKQRDPSRSLTMATALSPSMSGPVAQRPAEAIESSLRAGERLLWVGRPQTSRLAPTVLLWFLIGVLCVLFSPIFILGVLVNGDGPLYVAWGLLFFFAGSFLLWSGVSLRAASGAGTVYAVTSRRVLQRSGALFRFIPIELLPPRRLVARGAKAWVIFGRLPPAARAYAIFGIDRDVRQSATGPLTFYDIPDAENVERAIAEAQSSP